MSGEFDEYLPEFLEETLQGISDFEQMVIDTDPQAGAPDLDLVNGMFRIAHSLKGNALMLGLENIGNLSHEMESLLHSLRDKPQLFDSGIVDCLLHCMDVLRSMCADISQGVDPALDQPDALMVRDELANQIARLEGKGSGEGAHVEGGGKENLSPIKNLTTELLLSDLINNNEAQEQPFWRISFRPRENARFTSVADPLKLAMQMSRWRLSSVQVLAVDQLPFLDQMNPQQCYLGWEFQIIDSVSRSDLDNLLIPWYEMGEISIQELQKSPAGHNELSGDTRVGDINAEKEDTTSLVGNKALASNGGVADSVRVDISKIDELINLTGEVLIQHSMLARTVMNLPQTDDVDLEKLHEQIDALGTQMREMQENVMFVRMLPVRHVFNRLPRMVRDLSRKLGKKVKLQMTGQETELDKSVLEGILDPLIHLVRNAIDHGIESPQKRVAQGKPETGTLAVSAWQQGGRIVIEVCDDGKGIEQEVVVQRARSQGLLVGGDDLDAEQIYQFLFIPGFSTAKNVTDVSGRGVGLDVAARNIRGMGGVIDVTSTKGRGTQLQLKLPLTLAVTDGLLVRIGRQQFVVALTSILESVHINSQKIQSIAGMGRVIHFREAYIPVVDLRRIFHYHDAKSLKLDREENPSVPHLLLVLEAENLQLAIPVDELVGQQQIVIKNMELNYNAIPGIGGATILSDGKVALILDVIALGWLFRTLVSHRAIKVA